MNKIIILITFIQLSLINLSAKGVEIASFEWAPYSGRYDFGEGLHDIVVKKAFNKVGLNAIIKHYPWSRAYNLALQGKVLLMSASDTEERRKIFYYSDNYDNADSYLIGLKKNKINYNGIISSLAEYKIGIIRGHYLINLFKSYGVDKIEASSNDTKNILKLSRGVVNFIAMSKMPLLFLLRESNILKGKKINVIFYEPPVKKNPVHLIALKKKSSGKGYIEIFNKGLKEIKKDNTYEQIMEKINKM